MILEAMKSNKHSLEMYEKTEWEWMTNQQTGNQLGKRMTKIIEE